MKVTLGWRNKKERKRVKLPVDHLGKEIEGVLPGNYLSLVHSEIWNSLVTVTFDQDLT